MPLIFAANHAGMDEAGRGTLAGPVIAAAVNFSASTLPSETLPQWMDEIRDSKKLKPHERVRLAELIKTHADYGYGAASIAEIDRINILHATMLAMCRASKHLRTHPQHFWVDGNRTPALNAPTDAIIGGDDTHLPIAAASILAKVLRDALMVKLAKRYPSYLWESNKGYGSKAHLSGVAAYGITPHHRKSFAPIKFYLQTSS